MSVREGILLLATKFSGKKSKGTEQSDLLGAFSLDGADASDFLEGYMEKFNVDLSDLRWEFHFNADEPPHSRRILPIDADGRVIPYMPITLDQLVAAAEQGCWQFDYPEHALRNGFSSRFSLSIFAMLLVFLFVLHSLF
ncbi:MAG: hypothetical protein COB16_12325 [Rhodobacteraceae bacterium]|nr:MAG: hypothetical protein COB16_12325 [Paracoccaceae bacterium]